MAHLYIFLCIAFTVYGQLIIKARVTRYGALPDGLPEKLAFLVGMLVDPFILSGFVAAFLAALAWMAAMTRLELSYAYPFMSLSFVFVTILSVLFLGEVLTLPKVVGIILIIAGISVLFLGTSHQ